jgi:hypothetical protein
VAATQQVISAALVVERDKTDRAQKVQQPIYFVSKIPSDCEPRYIEVQKLLYAVILAKRKLLHCFESHPIMVVTSSGLGEVVNNQNAMGRVAKWAAELMGLDILYVPRSAIKSPALVDFVADWTNVQLAPEASVLKH